MSKKKTYQESYDEGFVEGLREAKEYIEMAINRRLRKKLIPIADIDVEERKL